MRVLWFVISKQFAALEIFEFRGAARVFDFACLTSIYHADCVSRLTVKSFSTRRTCARFDSLKINTRSNARDATLCGREVSRSSHRRHRRCSDCNAFECVQARRRLCMRSNRASSVARYPGNTRWNKALRQSLMARSCKLLWENLFLRELVNETTYWPLICANKIKKMR